MIYWSQDRPAFGLSTHPPHDGNGLGRQELWVADFIVDNAVKHFLLVVTREGRLKQRDWWIHDKSCWIVCKCELRAKHESNNMSKFVVLLLTKHAPLQPASQRWERPVPTSPQRGCTTFQSKPLELKTLVCRRTCWCGPGNPFLKAKQRIPSFWCVNCVKTKRISEVKINTARTQDKPRNRCYLLCKVQSQQSLHSPLYPGASYPASSLCKFKNIYFWNLMPADGNMFSKQQSQTLPVHNLVVM